MLEAKRIVESVVCGIRVKNADRVTLPHESSGRQYGNRTLTRASLAENADTLIAQRLYRAHGTTSSIITSA